MGRLITILILSTLFLGTQASAADFNFYCIDTFNDYRTIRYWARANISISDFEYGSGVCERNGLIKKIKEFETQPNAAIEKHFLSEFSQYVKKSTKLINVDEGRSERVAAYIKKNKNSETLFEEIDAIEESRRRSLYGDHPAALYCNISVSRDSFPILYLIETGVSAARNLYNSKVVSYRSLGYAAPEHLVEALNRDITEHMQEIGKIFAKIRSCPQPQK